MAIIIKNLDIFAKEGKILGRSGAFKHSIKMTTENPISATRFRLSKVENEVIDKEVQKLLDNKFIRPSNSAWSAPIVLAKKKDGTIRVCVDYRKINLITVRDVYPIPRIDDTIDFLQGARYFSTLDLASGYWQIEVQENDRHKTAFRTQKGLFEWEVMPMGLTNSPSTFQRAMDLMLNGLTWQCCLVYIDDIIIFSDTFEKHLIHLESVFSKIRE